MKAIQFTTKSCPYVHNIELDVQEFESIRDARCVLLETLKHEDRYEQVVESYVDAKTMMYEMSIRVLTEGISLPTDGRDYGRLNRLYFNTLNLSKLYLDKYYHEKHDSSYVKRVTRDIELHEQVSAHRQSISNDNIGYKIGCGLRNYVQHSSLPVKKMSKGLRHAPITDKAFSIFNIPIDKQELIASNTVKKSLLEAYDEKLDLHEIMDDYISAISIMHLFSRKLSQKIVDDSLERIKTAKNKIFNDFHDVNYGIRVVDLQKGKELFGLHLDWFELVNQLQKKNCLPLNFRNIHHVPYIQQE